MITVERPASVGDAGERDASISLRLLAALPVALAVAYVVGAFLIGNAVLHGWSRWWREAIVVSVLVGPPLVGAAYGWRAVRRGVRRGRIGLTLHLAVALIVLVL